MAGYRIPANSRTKAAGAISPTLRVRPRKVEGIAMNWIKASLVAAIVLAAAGRVQAAGVGVRAGTTGVVFAD